MIGQHMEKGIRYFVKVPMYIFLFIGAGLSLLDDRLGKPKCPKCRSKNLKEFYSDGLICQKCGTRIPKEE